MIRQNQLILVSLIAFLILLPEASHSVVVTCGTACVTSADAKSDTTKCLVIYSNYVYKLGSYSPSKFSDHDHFACGDDLTSNMKSSHKSSPSKYLTPYKCAPICPVATPTYSPSAGTYPSAQTVTLSTSTTGATIRYTLDGTTPTVNSASYTAPITISSTKTVKANAWKTGMTTSAVATATYTISLSGVAAPTFSPAAGTYSSAQTVALSTATTGATIRYTLDGTTPTAASPIYTAPITISSTKTVKANAWKTGMITSSVATATYTISLSGVAAPTFSPPAGTYPTAQSITLSTATSGATIKYTLDGTTPTANSAAYTAPITISSTKTVKANAWKTGMTTSTVAIATYTIGAGGTTVATPTFSPQEGTYPGTQSVTISTATSGATIRYTLDGTTPTTSSPLYTAPITVTYTKTIKAGGWKSGMTASNIASAAYTITSSTAVSAPTFSPPAGTYASAQTVTLSTATTGATIRYTLDGTNPTETSPAYTTPIAVSSTTTINANAWKTGMTTSNIASAAYNIGSLSLKTGWNQISSPIAEGIDVSTIEQSCTILQYKNQKLWAWDAQAQLWTGPTKVEPLKGYWIYLASACTVPVSGTPATFSTLQLYSGWNKISASGALSEISGTCAGHIVSNWVWNWDKTTTDKWIHPTTLQLDKGYWIRVDTDCILGAA